MREALLFSNGKKERWLHFRLHRLSSMGRGGEGMTPNWLECQQEMWSWREESNLQPAVYKFESEQSEPTSDNVTPQENEDLE